MRFAMCTHILNLFNYTAKVRLATKLYGHKMRVSTFRTKKKQSHYNPGQALTVPGVWSSHIQDNRHKKVVSPTHRPSLRPENIPGIRFYWRLSQPQGHSAAGRVMSMKNSNDITENRTRDLPTSSAVPQPTALPRGPLLHKACSKYFPPR
jgi:hypothetical protein